MQTIKEMIQQIQAITYDAYRASGQTAALLGEPSSPPEAMVKALEQTAASMEQGTVELRALCESCLPELLTIGRKPVLPPLDVAGSISVNEFGWLLIELNTLLPHCRFSTPIWLASVFSERLDTPQALLLAGESYRSVYAVLSRATPTQRNGKKGFVDYSQAYPQLGIPACLLSCDDTGALQLAIMRQTDYRAKIAQAAFGARWTAEDDRIPEADGQVDGNPLVIAVDMDLRRLDRVCRDARQQGRKEILVAALDGQMSGLLLEHLPKEAPVRPLRVNHKVLSVAFGGECALGDPWPDAPLNWKGGPVHV